MPNSPIEMKVLGACASKPYVSMTAMVMECFGHAVETVSESESRIDARLVITDVPIPSNQTRQPPLLRLQQPLLEERVRVDRLDFEAMQGDVGFVKVLEMMGCEVNQGRGFIEVVGRSMHGVDVDMNAMSDTVQSLAPVIVCEGRLNSRCCTQSTQGNGPYWRPSEGTSKSGVPGERNVKTD